MPGEIVPADTAPLEIDNATFEAKMRKNAKIRREREEYSVAELRVKISKLEQALTAEVQRRVDSTATLEQKTQEQIQKMEARLSKTLADHSSKISQRVDELEERLDALEISHERESEKQTKELQESGSDLRKHIHNLQREVENEKKERLVREARLLQQLESHARNLDEKWRKEQEDRITSIGTLSTTMQTQESNRIAQQSEWHSKISNEMQELQRELAAEIEERQAEDDQIIENMRIYHKQLQKSLSIVNGDDDWDRLQNPRGE